MVYGAQYIDYYTEKKISQTNKQIVTAYFGKKPRNQDN